MVGMIVAGLVLLLFIAALYMSSKNWRITHVLLLFGVFAMTAFFVFLAAGTLKTHAAWKDKYLDLTGRIERANQDIALLETGNIDDPDSVKDTIPHLKSLLAKQMVDRGRVWRGARPAGAAEGSIAIDMTGWGGTDCYGEPLEEDEDLQPEPDPVVEEPEEEPADDGTGDPVDDGAGDEPNPDEDPAEDVGTEEPDAYSRAGQPGNAPTDEDPAEEPAEEPVEEPAEEPVDEPAVVEAPAPAPAGPSTPHGIESGTVVYAFLEGASRELPPGQQKAVFGESELPKKDGRGACRVPVYYLGSFKVTSANGNSLQLTPVLPLDQQQVNIINAGQKTWTLFEVMPVDFHLVGDDLPPEALQGLFPQSPFAQAIVADYQRDMQPAQAGDADDQVEVQVKILKEHEVDVDAEAISEAKGGRFDEKGRATLPYLMQGAPTSLTVDAEMWVRGDIAKKWQDEGICERTEEPPRYVRPLRNYDLIFQDSQRRLAGMQSESEVFKLDNKTISDTADKARTQIKFRETEMEKIKSDQEGLSAEMAVLSRYQSDLQQAVTEQRQALSRLYRWNSQIADGLRGPVQNVGR